MTTKIGIVLYPDAEELDWAGPYEVFGMAGLGQDQTLVTVAERLEPVRSTIGLRVLPDHDFDSVPALDVVLVPGGQGSRKEMNNTRLLDWLVETAKGCSWITSVCTGSAILCRAGLAKGCSVTTHWGYIETLRELASDSQVLSGVRYVRDGRVVTAAGVSAGIDMSLWLVGQIYDREHARNTQRMMEYDPAPPYTANV